MLFANIEMFIAINKFVSDLFIAINKFYKLFLFMVFVRRNDLWQDKMVAIRSLSGESGLSPDKAMSESGRLTGCAYRLYLKVVALVSITACYWFAIRSNVSPTPDVRWRRRCGRGSRACRCGR